MLVNLGYKLCANCGKRHLKCPHAWTDFNEVIRHGCGDCYKKCFSCEQAFYKEDGSSCQDCEKIICDECLHSDGYDTYCNECGFYCESCSHVFPNSDKVECSNCSNYRCSDCINYDDDEEPYCGGC